MAEIQIETRARRDGASFFALNVGVPEGFLVQRDDLPLNAASG